MAIKRTEAIVIKSSKLNEADKLVHFYTRQYGRMRAVARGVRRAKSRFGSSVEIFTYSDLVFYQKPDEDLNLISQCDIKEPFFEVREDLTKLAYGSYVIELVDEMVGHENGNLGLFYLLLSLLRGLKKGQDPQSLVRAFEIRFMAMIGYMLQVKKCVSCGDKFSSDWARISPMLGGAICEKCLDKDKSAAYASGMSLEFIRKAEVVDPREIGSLTLPQKTRIELEEILHRYVKYYLEKEPKSLNFLRAIGL